MNNIINLSLSLLSGALVIITILLLVAFHDFFSFLGNYISNDGQITNYSRVVYTIYVSLFAIGLLLYLFKVGISRVINQPKISKLTSHIKVFYFISLFIIFLSIITNQSNLLFEEDGIMENLTAGLSFAASFIFLFLGLKHNSGIQRLFFYGFAGLLFLFAMEEISWGQRIIGWQSPELFMETNEQQETNLHNFFNTYFEILYIIFFTIVCSFFFLRKEFVQLTKKLVVLKPLANFVPSSQFFYAGFVFLFLLPFTMFFDKGGETLEPVFALLFFGYAYDLWWRYKHRKTLAESKV